MKIFETGSPVDRLSGDKPKRPSRIAPNGRLAELASRVGPLLHTKQILDKVYSNGYFETHYPDADKTLKGLLHQRAMDAWAHAEHFGSDESNMLETKESGEKQVKIVINLGA